MKLKYLFSRPVSYLIVGAVILASFAASCHADWYGMAGQSTYKMVGTGAWYVDELPHQISNRSFSWSIGYRGDSWRAGYIDLGRVEIDALAYYPDSAYMKGKPSGCADKGCAPANSYIGSFAVNGLFATYEPKLGYITLGVGPAVLRHSYRERVKMTAGENPYLPEGKQEAQTFNYNFACPTCNTQIQFTYVLTAGIEGKHVFINAQLYPNAFAGDGAFKGITSVFIGYKF